jgi:hypothetical protein
MEYNMSFIQKLKRFLEGSSSYIFIWMVGLFAFLVGIGCFIISIWRLL